MMKYSSSPTQKRINLSFHSSHRRVTRRLSRLYFQWARDCSHLGCQSASPANGSKPSTRKSHIEQIEGRSRKRWGQWLLFEYDKNAAKPSIKGEKMLQSDRNDARNGSLNGQAQRAQQAEGSYQEAQGDITKSPAVTSRTGNGFLRLHWLMAVKFWMTAATDFRTLNMLPPTDRDRLIPPPLICKP